MPYQLLDTDETEYELPEYPTGKQQREFNRLQINSVAITAQQKRQIAELYGWEEEYKDEDGQWDFPKELDIDTFRVKVAKLIFPEFDEPLNQETKDNLYGGAVMEGLQDFLSRCGGERNGRNGSSSGLMGLLSTLSEMTTTDQTTANG